MEQLNILTYITENTESPLVLDNINSIGHTHSAKSKEFAFEECSQLAISPLGEYIREEANRAWGERQTSEFYVVS